LRKHPIGVLQPLTFDPVNPKHEILRNLMWDMGYEKELGWWLLSHISHHTSSFEKSIATQT
jgi:hypothetical protein